MQRNNNIFQYLLILILFGCVILAMASCRTIQPTTGGTHSSSTDSIRTEYLYDSIYIDRWHTIWQQGDTVYIHDSIYQNRIKHDSIYAYKYINTTDTIYQTIEIEKQGAAFWKGSGIAFWILLALMVIGITIGLIIKFAK